MGNRTWRVCEAVDRIYHIVGFNIALMSKYRLILGIIEIYANLERVRTFKMLVRYSLPEASIAQLAEQSLRKRKVSGSIPLRGSFL